MSRLPLPHIDLSLDDAAKLRAAGFGQLAVYKWRMKKSGPTPRNLLRINEVLGRDALHPAPVAASNDATLPSETSIPVNRPAHVHIQVNPCVDDGVCLAVRSAAMRPIANTLLDARREIPCMNCADGIRRARAAAAKKRAAAAKKRAAAGRVGDICACGEPKSYGATVCVVCRDEKRKERNASL